MSVETEYRGYKIVFSENADEWNCWDVGFTHEKLSKVKEKIDRMHLQLRKASSVDCLLLDRDHDCRRPAKFYDGKIVDYIKPVRASRLGSFERIPSGDVIDHKVAIVASRHGDKAARRIHELSDAFSPSAGDALATIRAKENAVRAAKDDLAAFLKLLPRVQHGELAGLVAASEHVFSEGEQTAPETGKLEKTGNQS